MIIIKPILQGKLRWLWMTVSFWRDECGSNNVHEGDGFAVKLLADLYGGRAGLDDVDGQLQNLRQSPQLKKPRHRRVVFKADGGGGGDERLNVHPWTTHLQLSAPGCRVLHVAAVLLKLTWVPAWKWSNENWARRLIFHEAKLVDTCARYLTCTCRPCRRSSGRAGSRRRGFSCARLYVSGALSRS